MIHYLKGCNNKTLEVEKKSINNLHEKGDNNKSEDFNMQRRSPPKFYNGYIMRNAAVTHDMYVNTMPYLCYHLCPRLSYLNRSHVYKLTDCLNNPVFCPLSMQQIIRAAI